MSASTLSPSSSRKAPSSHFFSVFCQRSVRANRPANGSIDAWGAAEGSGQGRAGQDRAGQDRTGQGRAGQGRAGQDRTEQGRLTRIRVKRKEDDESTTFFDHTINP